jgi:hypothetical protein
MSDRTVTVTTTVTDDQTSEILSETVASVVIPPLEEPEPIPPPSDTWRVEVEHGGRVFGLDQEIGADLGTYNADHGNIHQRCLGHYVRDIDLTVFFRPEVDSSRMEVVFERGRCFAGNDMAADIGAYAVRIYNDDTLVKTIAIDHHYAFCRWRWQSEQRPIIAGLAMLTEQGLLPPYIYDPARAPIAQYVPYEPMGLAGIYPHMPDAGERPDIGLLTDPQAEHIVTGTASSCEVVFAQAEASGSIPWHMRDEHIGHAIDFEVYPKACWYQGQGQGEPFVYTPPHPDVVIDAAHQPALAYLPYLLTGDPYFLEALQFQATWNYGSLSLGYRPTLSQTRQFAWDMRTLGQCAAVTPADVPGWLQPRDYWQRRLDVHRDFFTGMYMQSESRFQTVFRATDNVTGRKADGDFPEGTWCQPWQSEFLGSVYGWLVAMGHEDWRAAFEWVVAGTIDRTGHVGWPRALCTPYQMMLCEYKGAEPASGYSEAWAINQEIAGLSYECQDTWEQDDMTYLTYTRGALLYAVRHGLDVGDNLIWVSSQFEQRQQLPAFKWSLGNELAGSDRA